jgi:hypothetical protein
MQDGRIPYKTPQSLRFIREIPVGFLSWLRSIFTPDPSREKRRQEDEEEEEIEELVALEII